MTLVAGSFPGSPATELCDPRLIDAFNDDATNHGTWDRSIAEPPQHDRLDSRGGRVEDAISDVIACKDSPDLSAIGTHHALYMVTLLLQPASAEDAESRATAGPATMRW